MASLDAVRRVTVSSFTVLCLLLVGTSGCGGKDPKPTSTTVTVKPAPGCLQIEQRKALARDIPKLDLGLRNQDVANFSAGDPASCNERQIVYWGPAPALPSQNRLIIFVRLTFTAKRAQLSTADLGNGARTVYRGGLRYAAVTARGIAAVRFATGATLVTVTAGCAEPSAPLDLSVVPCRDPNPGTPELKRRALSAASFLRPALGQALGSR